MDNHTNQTRWDWLASQREFCLRFLTSFGFSIHDAEEIFSSLVEWWRKAEIAGSLPDKQEKGLLTYKLRQLILDFVRPRVAKKRGGGVPDLGDDYLLDVAVDPVEPTFDLIPGAITLLKAEQVGASGRRQILLKVMLRGLAEGTSGKEWPDEFTAGEREEFMLGCEDWTDRDFRKAVSRTLSVIITSLRARAQLN